jgi:hypothetical protein
MKTRILVLCAIVAGTLCAVTAWAQVKAEAPRAYDQNRILAIAVTPAKAPSGPAAAEAPRVGVDLAVNAKQTVKIDKPLIAAITSRKTPIATPVNVDAQTPVLLHEDEMLLSRVSAPPKAMPATRSGGVAFQLPYEARFLGPAGELTAAHVVAEFAAGGLRVLGAEVRFTGELYVKLVGNERPDATGPLPHPIELLITGPIDAIVPAVLRVEALNAWATVKLMASEPADSVRIRFRPPFDQQGLEVPVPVIRPRLTVLVTPATVQGFGLEAANVVVRAEGLPNPAGRAVLLSATEGKLDQAHLVLDAQGVVATKLRSVGTSRAQVDVTSPPMSAGKSARVSFSWPVSFLLSSLLGGVVGALIDAARRKTRSRSRRTWWRQLSAGVAVGVVAAVSAATGINAFSAQMPAVAGEAAVFAFAALAAFGGLTFAPLGAAGAAGAATESLNEGGAARF